VRQGLTCPRRAISSGPISIPASVASRAPALVVSPAEFCRVTEFAIVCPITSRVRPFGTSIVLPAGLPFSGEILTSHVRSSDTLARPISYAGAPVPAAILDDVRNKLAALIGA
jgi:mRNA interferase MazF